MPKARIEVNEYLLYDIVDSSGKQVKVTRNLLNHYKRVTREFEELQGRLGKLLEEAPKPPEVWKYNLPDDDPAKLHPKEK